MQAPPVWPREAVAKQRRGRCAARKAGAALDKRFRRACSGLRRPCIALCSATVTNHDAYPCGDILARNFSNNKGRQERAPRTFCFGLTAACPPLCDCRNSRWAMIRGDLRIIWPIIGRPAEPNICGANGMAAIGSTPMALANSPGVDSRQVSAPRPAETIQRHRSLGPPATLSRGRKCSWCCAGWQVGAATIRISSRPHSER